MPTLYNYRKTMSRRNIIINTRFPDCHQSQAEGSWPPDVVRASVVAAVCDRRPESDSNPLVRQAEQSGLQTPGGMSYGLYRIGHRLANDKRLQRTRRALGSR